MTGGMPRQPLLPGWAAGLDAPVGKPVPATRPAPRPPADKRPRRISVTAVDRLKADPYEFYAKSILKLIRRDPVDRSEEHTSELQSLMRNSYAVFYLKKTKPQRLHTKTRATKCNIYHK